ncbi:MAG: dehypoxanthine futalosine cyclase [Planctomycetes bacterium]|nr:dehypoxanthine futalosine cyclase [Planctomycetota bacterium]
MAERQLAAISDRVLAGEPLSAQDGLLLHERADLATLGLLADQVRRRLHPERVVTYIVDRNINPTNVCITGCSFCAFQRRPLSPEAYVLPREEIYRKIDELVAAGGVLVLLQGGHHPHLRSDWFCELFADLKERYPRVHLHALSPPEIHHLARLERCPPAEIIARLKEAGLDSIPGGGAEILVDRVRRIISPRKATTDEWLEVSRQAHLQGVRTTATMMFGHVEQPAERVEHLVRLRQLQEETGGFTAFACWNFQNEQGVKLQAPKTSPAVYFRVLALSRLLLHNIPNIQASYVTQGADGAQMSLHFGANDFGGGMMEENVVSAAGTRELLRLEEIERQIEAAGFAPRRRDFYYNLIDARGPLHAPRQGAPS